MRVDVLVDMFRIVRAEELGEFAAGVLDEFGECLQAGQYDQVAAVDLAPEFIAGEVRVDEHGRHVSPLPPARSAISCISTPRRTGRGIPCRAIGPGRGT